MNKSILVQYCDIQEEVKSIDYKKINEQKKQYLRGYRRHSKRIKRIEAEIEEIRTMKESISVNNDGMPRGSGQSDLSGYVAQLDELENKKYQEGVAAVKEYKDIECQINQLCEAERDVLFYRYIKGLDWWEIAKVMDYTERHIYRLHGMALKNFKDVSPCQ